ncbi:hypothetical protein BY458DRAFT_482408 [Sporodiniella umbellata]|nr:hypothetical protein BY458DRAFT_482408 [Sporodiniella umbellata]
MGWGCTCKNQVPTVPPYHWPVSVAECRGKESSCINACSDGAIKDLCTKACSRYYVCDQAGSPPSGLKVDDKDIKPIYQVSVSDGSVYSFSLILIYATVIADLCFGF